MDKQTQAELKSVVDKFSEQNEQLDIQYRKGIITYEEKLKKELDILEVSKSECWAIVMQG